MAKSKAVDMAPVGPKQDKDGHDEYQVKNAAEDLMRAEEVKADPKLHKKAIGHMKKKMGNMKKAMSTDDLRAKAKEAQKMENDADMDGM